VWERKSERKAGETIMKTGKEQKTTEGKKSRFRELAEGHPEVIPSSQAKEQPMEKRRDGTEGQANTD